MAETIKFEGAGATNKERCLARLQDVMQAGGRKFYL